MAKHWTGRGQAITQINDDQNTSKFANVFES